MKHVFLAAFLTTEECTGCVIFWLALGFTPAMASVNYVPDPKPIKLCRGIFHSFRWEREVGIYKLSSLYKTF